MIIYNKKRGHQHNMDERTKDVLEGIFTYAEILNETNLRYHELINENTEKKFNENERLFYEITSEIMRLIPFKKLKDGSGIRELDMSSGILLLSKDIDFLAESYQDIIDNKVYETILMDMSTVRNKFVHQPHNIRAGFYVGGKTSCSMGLYYKDKLCNVSTIKIANIIYELNEIFCNLQEYTVEKMNECEDKYKDYSCFQTMMSYNFKQYNLDYPKLPEWIVYKEDEVEFEP